MTSFEGARLDDADALTRHDHARLLWTLALSGAQLRRAAQVATEWHPTKLSLDGPPRALLVATDGPTSGIADLLQTLATPVAPTAIVRSPQLPRWAGAADAALIVSLDGRHPRLVALTEQAARRGLSLAVIAPVGSPVAAAAGRGVVVDLPSDTAARAAFWSAFGPALVAADAWALTPVDARTLEAIAAGLDETAQQCRPGGDLLTNPAKSLAEEFAESTPVLVGAGPLAAVAARHGAGCLQLSAGSPAVAFELPDDIARVTALLVGEPHDPSEDFFRDRADVTAGPRPRVLVIGDEGDTDDPQLGFHDNLVETAAGEQDARSTARLVHEVAAATAVRASTLAVPAGDPLVRMAAAIAFGGFTAAYLALGSGLDPSAPRPGEDR